MEQIRLLATRNPFCTLVLHCTFRLYYMVDRHIHFIAFLKSDLR